MGALTGGILADKTQFQVLQRTHIGLIADCSMPEIPFFHGATVSRFYLPWSYNAMGLKRDLIIGQWECYIVDNTDDGQHILEFDLLNNKSDLMLT